MRLLFCLILGGSMAVLVGCGDQKTEFECTCRENCDGAVSDGKQKKICAETEKETSNEVSDMVAECQDHLRPRCQVSLKCNCRCEPTDTDC